MKKTLKNFALLLSASLVLSSCIGSFQLTNKVKDWNDGVGDKWINEVVFLAFHIIPVYENEKEVDIEEIEKVLILSWEY